MRVTPSEVPGVEIHAPDSPEFEAALPGILGCGPEELLRPAIPYSVILGNTGTRTIAFFGVRFDMLGAMAKQYSVVHYADTLRNPAQADFRPGAKRFVCAEPEYTSLVIRGNTAPESRGRANLSNLRRMLGIRASIDCAAFEDGQFAGPDSREAFGRLAHEGEVESELMARVLSLGEQPWELERLLCGAAEDASERARRSAARKLLEGWRQGGAMEALARARDWHYRIALWR